MYNLYFFEIYDHHQSGFVTYMNELIVGLQQQCDAKLNVVILASPTSDDSAVSVPRVAL